MLPLGYYVSFYVTGIVVGQPGEISPYQLRLEYPILPACCCPKCGQASVNGMRAFQTMIWLSAEYCSLRKTTGSCASSRPSVLIVRRCSFSLVFPPYGFAETRRSCARTGSRPRV